MTHGSLFSGIGGFDLAAEWMGWENVFHCERDKFCSNILKYYWPHACSYKDIKTANFLIWRGRIDVLSGGFPCQPFSQAGQGKGADDDRYLWPEMLRAIRESRPTWVVAENVYGLLNQGGGLVFEQVCADLEREGYQVRPYLLPACGVNAPHQRNRFYFVAFSDSYRLQRRSIEGELQQAGTRRNERSEDMGIFQARASRWENFPTESPLYRGDDGVPFRVDRVKALGNAIVPQVAFEIFKAIETFMKHD